MPDARSSTANPRGDETRRRLLAAALEAFSRHGYDGVSTRQLAQRAGVNLAAIPYHFGSKAGVYQAVVDGIAEGFGEPLRRAADAARTAASDPALGPAARCARLREFLQAMARQLLGSADARLRSGIILREQIHPTPAFDAIYRDFIHPVHETVAALLGGVLGRAYDDPEIVLRTHAVIGQIVVFRAARETIMRRMDWDGFTPERVEQIAHLVGDQVCAMLLTQQHDEART
jgi:AcrR family transcriptional regulator